MPKRFYLLPVISALLCPVTVLAQLPANPWAAPQQPVSSSATVTTTSSTAAADITNSQTQSSTTSSAFNSASTPWRGSGQFFKLGYTGEVTTYDKAQGQEMLAPEVNNTNMNIMIQHLRQLGYSIPASYDDGFSNFLQDYTTELRTAYSGLGRQNNPFDTMFNSMIDAFENFTGLDVGNLMFNSLDLIQRE